jgi:thiamine biosynthesis lipoprotein ApbE
VDFKEGIHNIELHPAWRAWLAGMRENAPTPQELHQRRQQLAQLKENVKKLEMEDAKLRAQEQMGRDRND